MEAITMQTHKVPIRMGTPDKIVLGLTAKQLLIVLIGCSIGYNIWIHLYTLMAYGIVGMIARFVFALVPAGMIVSLALIKVAGRSLDVWVLVALRYLSLPRIYVWRSIRYSTLLSYEEGKTWQSPQTHRDGRDAPVSTLQLWERGEAI
jgi:PrgI family protein